MSRWRWTDLALTHIFAGFLPTVGRPSAVALVSYFSFDVDHLVYCHSKVSSLVQGTFTPQQSRPCRAYPSRAPEHANQANLKWKISRACRVTRNVRRSETFLGGLAQTRQQRSKSATDAAECNGAANLGRSAVSFRDWRDLRLDVIR